MQKKRYGFVRPYYLRVSDFSRRGVCSCALSASPSPARRLLGRCELFAFVGPGRKQRSARYTVDKTLGSVFGTGESERGRKTGERKKLESRARRVWQKGAAGVFADNLSFRQFYARLSAVLGGETSDGMDSGDLVRTWPPCARRGGINHF